MDEGTRNKGKWLRRSGLIVCPECGYSQYNLQVNTPKFCCECGGRRDGKQDMNGEAEYETVIQAVKSLEEKRDKYPTGARIYRTESGTWKIDRV